MSSATSYLDVQQARQLRGLVMSLAASRICDENNRQQEVVVFVHKLSKSPLSSRNHRAASQQDAVHVKEDAHLRRTGHSDTQLRKGHWHQPPGRRSPSITSTLNTTFRRKPAITHTHTHTHSLSLTCLLVLMNLRF